jgi:tRNA(Ile)-lysidine synthase
MLSAVRCGCMTDLSDKVEQANAPLFSTGQRILVAVSGGLDSMVLLHVLHRLAPAKRWRLTVAHLNHQLRGRSSDADQKLVERVARRMNLPIVAERLDVSAMAAQGQGSLEMVARRVRHEFLARVAKENRISTVALAHHADDQVELFFLRLLRGAGADGLSGMEPVAVSPADPNLKLVRPLLSFTRREIEECARRERIPFREDASNRSTDYLRNRIRHELLPLLERKFQPAVRKVVLRTMELLSADAEFSWHAALEWLRDKPADFESLHLAVQRRVLQDQLIEMGIAPDFFVIERLRREPQQAICIEPGKLLLRDATGRLHIQKDVHFAFDSEELEINLASTPSRVVFDGMELSWKLKDVRSPKIKRVGGREQFDAGRVGSRVVVRHWRKGDRFQPIGMSNPVKLQDLFANAKVPKEERHKRTVAVAGNGEIFWIEGFRISEQFKLRTGTRRVLEWKWRRT